MVDVVLKIYILYLDVPSNISKRVRWIPISFLYIGWIVKTDMRIFNNAFIYVCYK